MSFWADKIAETQAAAPPPPPPPRTSWLDLGRTNQTAPQQPQNAPQQAQVPPSGDYLPPTAAVLQAEDERCPRCGSEEYVQVPPDAEFGGVRAGVVQPKRCFSCRYPGVNPSGSLGRPGMASVKGTKVRTLHPRQAGGGLDGIWSDSSWDSAPLIA